VTESPATIMPNLTPEKEALVLEALRVKFAGVSGMSNVIVEMPVIDSKQDEIDKLTVTNVDGELEIKYCYVSFLGYEDSATDGCDDAPLVYLNYQAHLFWGFKEKRSDNSSSEKDFKTLFINTRSKFLETGRTLAAGAEHTPLAQTNSIILGDDPLTGAYGFFVDLSLRVEVP
ncbi:MAG: hypothetical protein ACREBC_32250, partial [Pyrinomonadaceae bacterium]